MAPSKIQITTPETALAPCASSPQLMPFHIAYSGPAPVATFFRVREFEEETPSASPWAASSNGADAKLGMGKEEASSLSLKAKIGKRLVAAFRGRRVVGVEVPLPDGYTGLILRSDAPGKPAGAKGAPLSDKRGTAKRNGNAKGGRKASTRRTRRAKAIEIKDDEDTEAEEPRSDMMDLDNDAVDPSLTLNADSDEGEVRTLKATQTFQSLLIWNADVAVDEGRDEYIRALREWTALAAEVHRIEE